MDWKRPLCCIALRVPESVMQAAETVFVSSYLAVGILCSNPQLTQEDAPVNATVSVTGLWQILCYQLIFGRGGIHSSLLSPPPRLLLLFQLSFSSFTLTVS